MNEHDALIDAINAEPTEGTPLAAFADHLEENGKPGAKLARAGVESKMYKWGNLVPQEHIRDLHGNVIKSGSGSVWPIPAGDLEVHLVRRMEPTLEPKSPIYLRVTHTKETADEALPLSQRSTQYRVPVHSLAHLDELLSDLPEAQRKAVRAEAVNYLPDTHVEHYARQFMKAVDK